MKLEYEWNDWTQRLNAEGRRVEEFRYAFEDGSIYEHKKVSYKYAQTPIGKVVTEMLMEDFFFDRATHEEYKGMTLRETYDYGFVEEEK